MKSIEVEKLKLREAQLNKQISERLDEVDRIKELITHMENERAAVVNEMIKLYELAEGAKA